jgi:hypothetical protein
MSFRFHNPKEVLFTEEGANKYLPAKRLEIGIRQINS